ncbi:hypothetical protein CSHISOI_10461, partial [Colletotrichum shisoi]
LELLQAQVTNNTARKRRTVQIDPNAKFANIKDIQKAQIEAGKKEDITDESSEADLPKALIWTLWAAAFGMTVFRGSFQWILQRRLYADDYFIIVGLAALTALSAVVTMMLPQFYLAGEYTKAAAVNPLAPLPLPLDGFTARTVASLKLMFSQTLLFWTTLWAAKFSILFFVRRLVNGLPRYIRACHDASPSSVAASSPPLDPTKLGLAVLFSLGGIIIAFAIARLIRVTKATGDAAKDPTTVANGPALLSMWSHIESSVSIIVATLPAFRFLLGRNRTATRKTTNKCDGPTIGGSGDDSYRHGSAQGSETELTPVRGIQKEIMFKTEHSPGELAVGETKRRTQDLFA